MIDFVEIAKIAHRKSCPMVNCVDCLFGMCDSECDYQVQFEKELKEAIEYYERRNDNQRTLP